MRPRKQLRTYYQMPTRLPVGKSIAFKIPLKADAEKRQKYESRKIDIVDRKTFKNPSKTAARLFSGSLKIN
jgi:hypothetical protein